MMATIKGTTGSDPSLFSELAMYGELKFHHAIAELLDNSISAGKVNKMKPIEITIQMAITKKNLIETTVRDNSGGIPLNILRHKLFCVAAKVTTGKSKTHMNEHGMGFLNVMSNVEDQKGNWEITTTTRKSMGKNKCYSSKSPYATNTDQIITEKKYASHRRIGTTIKFTVPLNYAGTVGFGALGQNPSTIEGVATLLRQHLGVYYRPDLQKGAVIITIDVVGGPTLNVGANTFSLVDQIKKLTPFKIPIPGEPSQWLNVKGQIGLVPDGGSGYYYAGTTTSRGVDVLFGARVIASRLISEIWTDTKGGPIYNRLGGEIIVRAQNKKTPYPKTKPDKSGIKSSDTLWERICAEIVKQIPPKSLPQWKKGKNSLKAENLLQDELKKHLESPGGKFPKKKGIFEVCVRQPVDAGSNIEADVVVRPLKGAKAYPLLIECKVEQAGPIDAYQLIMYWHAITSCQKIPGTKPAEFYDIDEGWIVAESHTAGLKNLVTRLNATEYTVNGKTRKFNIDLMEWADLGISIK